METDLTAFVRFLSVVTLFCNTHCSSCVLQEGKAEQELLVDVGSGGGGSGKGHTWDNWDDDWEKVDAQ